MSGVEKNLTAVKKLISKYEQKYGREHGSVRLLAVSKAQPIEKIVDAIHAGQREFGENHLQEALIKMTAIPDPSVVWHFLGPVQSNKTRKIAERFSWVHSVDEKKIAERLNDQRPSHLPPLNICIQINVSNEQTKSGIKLEELPPLAELCRSLPRLKLRGLMAIPAPSTDFDSQRHEFHKLWSAWNDLRAKGYDLDTLSMGMSEDFPAAIAEGSTIVRLGTAIFGERDTGEV